MAWVASQIREMRAYPVRKFEQNVADLEAGRRHDLSLIGLGDTDSLLEQIRGMPEVEDVFIDVTDITVVGMRHLGTLPNLKTVLAYSIIGDEGLLQLRRCTKLEKLVIYDLSITQQAVAELKRDIPNVRVATSHDDEPRQETSEANRAIETAPPVKNPAARLE
jgi:hypothetical protein